MPDPRDVVNKSIAAWSAHDVDGVLALYAEDAVLRGPAGLSISGHAALRALMEDQFAAYPDEHSEVRRQFVDGDVVISETHSTATHQGTVTLIGGEKVEPTSRPVSQDIVYIDHVIDGRIAETVMYYDRHDFLEQIGHVPVAAPATAPHLTSGEL